MATGQTHGGKGSSTRPTDKKKYEDNYDAIFGKKYEDNYDATDISVGTIKEKLKGVSYEPNR